MFWQALQGRLLKSSSHGVPFILKVIGWLFYFCKPYTGDFPLHALRMPRTRDLARIDYSKLNVKGFDSDSFEMDVLNLSDPNSDLFDNEEYNIVPMREWHELKAWQIILG